MPFVMTSPGFSERQVYINTINKSASMAYCSVVGTNASMTVSTVPVRCGRSPRAGETWVVEKSQSGSWVFTAILATQDAITVPPVVFGANEPKLQSDYVGQRYVSLSQPNGATMWESVASNSDHWRVVRGETDWVEGTPTVGSGVTIGNASFKRIDSRVIMLITGLSSGSSGTASVGIPDGFLMVSKPLIPSFLSVFSDSGVVVGSAKVTSDKSVNITLTKAGAFVVRDEWTTTSDWPSLS